MPKLLHLYKRALHLFVHDSLFRNAVFLMASTGIMSVLGFAFWVFIAHLYTPEQIGIASALIAVTTLLSNISLLGLNAGLIRFLPESKNQSRDINAAIITVGSLTMLAAAIYVLLGKLIHLDMPLLSNGPLQLLFIGLMATVSLNSLTDAVFVANRRAEFHTIGYTLFAVVKLVAPMVLVSLGALGIFAGYMAAVIVSLLVSLFFMRWAAGYKLWAAPNFGLLRKTYRYAVGNYLGVILAGLPSQLMPILIMRRIGSENVAYFSMAWTMANLLYIVPSAVTQSLLAESSHDPAKQRTHIKHTGVLLAKILIPAIVLAVLVAPWLLDIFGQKYSEGSTQLFQIFALATVFIALNSIGNAILNIQKRPGGIVLTQLFGTLTVAGSAEYLLGFGLRGVGISMLLGNVVACLCQLYLFIRRPLGREAYGDTADESRFEVTYGNLGRLLEPYGISKFMYRVSTNGSSNSTVLVKYGNVLKVLRIYRQSGRTDAEILAELRFMRYLSAYGIPVPGIVREPEDSGLRQAKIDGATWNYILMDFSEGSHPPYYSDGLIKNMARVQALIHICGIAYARDLTIEELIRLPQSTTWINRYFGGILLRKAPWGFSHFDYDASNLLTKGNSISCVLDFEGMRYGPLVSCVYFTLRHVYSKEHKLRKVRLYVAEYQRLRRLNPLEKLILSSALSISTLSLSMFNIYE